MKQITIILLSFLVLSCNEETKLKKAVIRHQKELTKTDSLNLETPTNQNTKVKIDFLANKDLLDIILLLPDSSFSSWTWELEDRKKWYNEIKANNFYIDKDSRFFNLKLLEPNKANFGIVDGSWSICIYKTTENSFIVITDDLVGDGNEINTYEVKSTKIKSYLNEKLIFHDHVELIKQKNDLQNCGEEYEVLNDPIFRYNFLENNKIEIESSWTLTEEEYKDCLIGNSVLYNFNPETKEFNIEKVYWKPKQEN